MQRVPVDEILPGAVLAEDVLDAAGHVLLQRGATLSESMLASLRRRGIGAVSLALPTVVDEEQLAARRRLIEDELASRFRNSGDGQASGLLRRAALEYLLEKSACTG